jgi:hypothetical protein
VSEAPTRTWPTGAATPVVTAAVRVETAVIANATPRRMPTPCEIELPRRDSMTALEHGEESFAIGGERQILPRRQGAFDPMNAHSQADEPPLSVVMEFNAAEREWHEAQARLNKKVQDIENSLRR